MLECILEKGGAEIRQCELHEQFAVGGQFRKRSPQDSEKKTFEQPLFPMTNWQFYRILERLEFFNFIERNEVTPPSKRTKGRKKLDVFYSVSLDHITWEDMGQNPQTGEGIWKIVRHIYDDPFCKTDMVRKELLEIDLESISSEELENKLQGYAHWIVHIDNDLATRWAKLIPESNKRLRTMLLNYLGRGGHTYWAYAPPSSNSKGRQSI